MLLYSCAVKTKKKERGEENIWDNLRVTLLS